MRQQGFGGGGANCLGENWEKTHHLILFLSGTTCSTACYLENKFSVSCK